MASSAAEQRQAVADLSGLAVGELGGLWGQFSGWSALQVRDALMELLPAIFDQYGPAAASLAADWFEELRAEAAVAGRFGAVLAPAPVEAQWKNLIGRSIGGLFGADPRPDDVLTLLQGGLQRSVANQHRLTVVESTRNDPHAKGWKRVGVGGNCKFCDMLISRGSVYHKDTALFRAHDSCNCAASPTWAENVVYVTGEPYRQSQARPRSAKALRKRNQAAYDWIAEHE